MPDDAIITMDPDGRYTDASPAALDILGVTREQLLAAPPGAFSAQPDDPDSATAFRRSWEAQGKPDITGEATIQRPDGGQRRVKFHIARHDDGTFVAMLWDAETATDAPAKVMTAGDVLAAWRDAERRMETIAQDSPEWSAIQADIARFREAYHRAFDARAGRARAT